MRMVFLLFFMGLDAQSFGLTVEVAMLGMVAAGSLGLVGNWFYAGMRYSVCPEVLLKEGV